MWVHVGANDIISVCFPSGFALTAPTFWVPTIGAVHQKGAISAHWCKIQLLQLDRKQSKNEERHRGKLKKDSNYAFMFSANSGNCICKSFITMLPLCNVDV